MGRFVFFKFWDGFRRYVFFVFPTDVIKKVLTEPSDRIMTGELFPVIEDLAAIQDYMCDKMGIIKSKIDLEKFVDTQFATAAGAK